MITITLTMRCPDHPGYTGARTNNRIDGRGNWCGACYDIHAIRHPDSYEAEITIQEVNSGS